MPNPLSLPEPVVFAVSTADGPRSVTVSIRGELDASTAPVLAAALDDLQLAGQDHLVLDMERLTFLGVAGLRVIGNATTRQTDGGGTVTITSAPRMVRRLLDLAPVEGLALLSPLVALGAGHRAGDRSVAVVPPTPQLGPSLANPDTGVLDAALRLVTLLVSATIPGADGASVSLPRHGRMVTVASSDDTVLRMDAHQYDTGEGPCLAAAAAGDWVHVESLATEARWPAFVPLAIDEGIASILSTPLLSADRPLGALNIYSNTERAFGPDEQGLAALFATQASAVLADADLDLTEDRWTSAMGGALRDRSVIAQAQGVLMAREHITEYEAAARLHRSARVTLAPVVRLAAEVVASTRSDAEPDPMGSDGG